MQTVEATTIELISYGLACFAVGYSLATWIALILLNRKKKD